MYDYIPFVLKREESTIKQEIAGRDISVIFDGTTRLGEALAIVIRYIGDDWSIQQRLVRVQMLSKSMTGEEIARELISVLSVIYSIKPGGVLGAMRDRASTNNVAMQTMKILHPTIIDIGCYSHTIDTVGSKFETPVVKEFISSWISLFSHSPKARLLWKNRNGHAVKSYSATRWWSRWEVINQVMTSFGDIQPFLQENSDLAPHLRPKLLKILTDQHSRGLLLIELAATVDYGEVFVKATYRLEGDGPLALTCYEEVEKVSSTIRMENIPNVRAIATKLSGKPPTDPLHEQWVTYARNCVHPGLNYFQTQLTTSLKNSMEVFKTCRLCSPSKVYSMQPDSATLHDALQCLPFLGASEISALTAELPTYLSKAAGVCDSFDLLEW